MSLVVQLFDVSLEYIENFCLKKCKEFGVNYVLFPPQQTFENINNEWWSVYQPDFLYNISDEDRLTRVISEFNKNNIHVLIDVIFSHTNKKGYLENKDHYIYDPNKDNTELNLYWIDTTKPEIIKKAHDMIKKYRKMGVKGFRIDSAIKVDHRFYDYVFDNSPSYEIQLYEVLDLSIEGKNFMKRRINFRPYHTFFYDIKELDNSITIVKKINNINKIDKDNIDKDHKKDKIVSSELFYEDTIIPDNGVSIISTHDLLTNRWYLEFDLFKSGLLSAFMTCHPFIFITICSIETSSIYNCSLWSWEILKYFMPIIDIRKNNKYSPSVLYNYYNNIVVQNLNSIFFLNLADSGTSNHQGIYDLNGVYKDIYTKKIFDNKINLPENKLLILEKIDRSSKHNNIHNNIHNIHMFWYQGWENAPSFAKRSQSKWKELASSYSKHSNVILWDYKNVMKIIDQKDPVDAMVLKLFNKIDEKIRIPEKYATFSDIARLFLLYKYGGIYVDTDSFPTKDSWLLFNFLNTRLLMFGREPNGYINNAIIISSIHRKETVKQLLTSLSKTILQEDISHTNILNIAGPQKLTDVINSKHEDYKQYIFIIPTSWLYSTWSSEKTRNIDENCTDDIVIAQHCYAGSWVVRDTKYDGYDGYNGYGYGYGQKNRKNNDHENNDQNIYLFLIFTFIVVLLLSFILFKTIYIKKNIKY